MRGAARFLLQNATRHIKPVNGLASMPTDSSKFGLKSILQPCTWMSDVCFCCVLLWKPLCRDDDSDSSEEYFQWWICYYQRWKCWAPGRLQQAAPFAAGYWSPVRAHVFRNVIWWWRQQMRQAREPADQQMSLFILHLTPTATWGSAWIMIMYYPVDLPRAIRRFS